MRPTAVRVDELIGWVLAPPCITGYPKMATTNNVDIHIIAEARKGKKGCYVNYVCRGDELGKAIMLVLDDLKSLRLRDPRVSLADIYERSTKLDGFVRCAAKRLYRSYDIHTWPADTPDRGFMFPLGVVPIEQETPFDVDDIAEGYRIFAEDSWHFIEIMTDGRRLYSVLRSLFKYIMAPQTLDIGLSSHWDETGVTEIWRAEKAMSGNKILHYLKDKQLDIIHNGYVDFAVLSRAVDRVLAVSDHKIITFYSKTNADIRLVRPAVRALGFHRRKHLRSVAQDCYHYHYRLPGSLSRGRLVKKLQKDGFRKVHESSDD